MRFIGSTIYMLWMIVTILIFAPLVVLAWPLPFAVRSELSKIWSRLQLWALRVFCGLHYNVKGRENIPDHAVIVVAKHQSTWETIALQCVLGPQTWVMKRELLWLPLFGWGLMAMRAIAIDRSSGKIARQQIIDQGVERLKEGISIIVFPEGTRVPPLTEKRFGVGGAILAAESGVPILPVAHNAGHFWRRKAFMKRPGTVQMVIGPLIETKNRDANDINAQAYAWMQTNMAEIERGE